MLDFLPWHYSKGLESFVKILEQKILSVLHYFSFFLLLKTLFAPWKRLRVDEDGPGFDITRTFQAFTFNIVSRVMGAIVRLLLIFTGLITLIVVFVICVFSIALWIVFPPVGFFLYFSSNSRKAKEFSNLVSEMSNSKDGLDVFFASDAGIFVTKHLGVDKNKLIELANDNKSKVDFSHAKNISEIIDLMIKGNYWSEDVLRKMELVRDDINVVGMWWDKSNQVGGIETSSSGSGTAIALELLFGYTPTLNQYSSDLSKNTDYSHRLIGREETVSKIARSLSSGNNVFLTGDPGIGKKTVVLEFARRAALGLLSKELSYHRVLEFDYNALLSGAKDINAKKKELSNVLEEASFAGNIILVIRDMFRITNADIEGYDFTDIFEELFEKRNLKVISITTPLEYERHLSRNMRLRKFFDTVEVAPPTMDKAMEILVDFAITTENSRKICVTTPVLRKIIEESDRYISDTPFPEKAIEILDALVLYKEQVGEGSVLSIDDVNKVLAEKTGISFESLSKSEKNRLANIEDIIHERLVNQNVAVDKIARSLRSRTVGLYSDKKPIGSFLFLGPTGVGKTQTAKALAKVYFGSENEIIRFNMAEFTGGEGVERLVGSMSQKEPGVMTNAIKNNPASLLLLDEIEKAPKEVTNLFLTLLDEGEMRDVFDRKINGRNLFIIATSNAGAEYIRSLVGQNVTKEELQSKVVDFVLKEKIFSPEFLNRFDAVVVYEPLTNENLKKVSRLMVDDFAKNLIKKNIKISVGDQVIDKIANDGNDPAFGARPIERIVNLEIGDMLSKAIVEDRLHDGDNIEIILDEDSDSYAWRKQSSESSGSAS